MPIEETLRALEDLVKMGKARYIGGANFESWRLTHGQWTTRQNGWSPMISSQFSYSLLNRTAEQEMIPACRELGIGVIPYLPLSAGMLTGKVSASGEVPADSRLGKNLEFASKWLTPDNLKLIGELTTFAQQRGRTILELAIAWLLAEPLVGTVISGASKPGQVTSNAAAADWQLNAEELTEVASILERCPASEPDLYYSKAAYFSEPT